MTVHLSARTSLLFTRSCDSFRCYGPRRLNSYQFKTSCKSRDNQQAHVELLKTSLVQCVAVPSHSYSCTRYQQHSQRQYFELLGTKGKSCGTNVNLSTVSQLRTFTTDASPKKKKSKVKKMLKEYGPVFLCFHLFTSCITYATFYTLVSRGFDTSSLLSLADTYTDVDTILTKAGYSRALLLEPPSPSSSAVIALLLYKLSGPIRLFLDSLAVPMLVRLLRQIGIMEPVNPVNEAQAERVLNRIEALDKKLEAIDLTPVQRAFRKQVQGRRERRSKQLVKYADTQRKIEKVFRKKSTKGGPRGR